MHRPIRHAFAVVLSLLGAAVATAAPRDEVLRIAPTDAAVVIVVQNARAHFQNLAASPFVRWFPSTAIGKKLLESADLQQLRDSVGAIFSELGTTPASLLEDVLGDAFAFAFTPATAGAQQERAVLIVRPRKPDVLAKLVERLNDLQTRSGEVKEVVRKEYAGSAYHERLKPAGGADYYCFRGDLFFYSSSEAELKACLDRDKTAPTVQDKAPELLTRLTKLGVADSAGVLLINPRALDGEVKAKAAAAKADEKRFLARFAEVWSALDVAAVYLTLDRDLEAGVALRFQSEKLPPDLRKWLTGPRNGTLAERLIPKNALFGASGQVRATDLIELIASITPLEPGKAGVKKWIADTLGPIVGKDKLPTVLDALGPDWAVWAEPPAKDEPLPTFVAAVELRSDDASRARTEKAVLDALEFAFKMARVSYNSSHTDQIEVKEEKDPRTNATITTLVNGTGFPPGFRPSFAIVRGYLVLATSPDAIKRFEPPSKDAPPTVGTTTVARVSGKETRAYLLANGPHLAKFLADLGVGPEKTLVEQLANLAAVLELIDSATIVLRGDDASLTIAARIVFARPLK